MDDLRRAPLAALHDALAAASGDLVTLREVPFLAQVNVRADEPAARALALPLEPNTTVARGAASILWLGPDEWLATGDDAAALVAALETPAGWVTTVDLSANRTAIEVAGPGARDVLAAGCSLDLHPRAFGPGHCAQTLVARAQVILEARGEAAFRLLVRCSFATYLARWLMDAAALVEHDRAVGMHEDPVLQVPPHGA